MWQEGHLESVLLGGGPRGSTHLVSTLERGILRMLKADGALLRLGYTGGIPRAP